MDSNTEEVIILSTILVSIALAIKLKKKRMKRRWGVRPIFQRREQLGHFHKLFQYMKNEDSEQFFKYTRMSVPNFNYLLGLLSSKLEKNSTRALSPEHRLVLTLYYLAHGCSMQVVSWSFLVGKSTVSLVIRETCLAIWEVLSPLYIPSPTSEDFENIASDFYNKWNFPNCCGAMDGKHVQIQAPKKSGSEYFNYKKTFSIVLMGVCDANYKFILLDIGAIGSRSDGGIFSDCDFGRALKSGALKLPADKILPGTNTPYPHFLVADEAFPLQTYIMKPFPGTQMNNIAYKVYNYRLSRARRIIENAFGILASRWRIFRTQIIAEVDTAERIVAATCCLHNFLRVQEMNTSASTRLYCPPGFTDTDVDGIVTPGTWRNDVNGNQMTRIGRQGSNYSARNIASLRQTLANYLLSPEGAVSWQLNHVSRGSRPSN